MNVRAELRSSLGAGLATILIISGIVFGLRCLIVSGNESRRAERRYQIEECLTNTADPKWCYEKFGLPPSP